MPLLVVHVHVHVKPEHVAAFQAATLATARASVQEPGIARFDVVQQVDDPTRFVLVEVCALAAERLCCRLHRATTAPLARTACHDHHFQPTR